MNYRRSLRLALVLLAVCLIGCQSQRPTADRWTAPAVEPSFGQIPYIPAVIDGDLKEWSDLGEHSPAIVTASTAGCIAQRNPEHEWRGPRDASMIVRVGWAGDAGLCL